MSRELHYDPAEGEFVDFETLDDWRVRDVAKDAEIERLRDALAFYAEHGAGCRLIHSGGDLSRNALADDGGKKAQFALAQKESSE
jgi:hypothetical protein